MAQLQELRDREMAMQLHQSYNDELESSNRETLRNEQMERDTIHQQPYAMRLISGVISRPFATEPPRKTESYTYPPSPRKANPIYAQNDFSERKSDGQQQRDISYVEKVPIANDSALAKALQAMEFEIADETYDARNGTTTGDERYQK